MYGQIHVIIRSLVTSEFGEETWTKIASIAGVDEAKDFLVFQYYDDSMCSSLVAAASKVLGVGAEAVLDVFGDYFIKYVMDNGYDTMLRTLGNTFEKFIQNLDSLHSMLKLTYSNLSAPSFRCETLSNGEYLLHYYSTRTGLHPIVSGCIRAVGRELYGVTMTAEVLEISESDREGITKSHVLFKVKVEGDVKLPEQQIQEVAVETFMPRTPIIQTDTFCFLFPYHVVFDQQLEIRQCGVKLRELAVKSNADMVSNMKDLFHILHPPIPFTFASIQDFINANYLMEVKNTKSENGKQLLMRGQMMALPDSAHMLFVGSPRLASLIEMMQRRLFFSDIPIHDVTRELILLNQQRSAEIEISKKLDETTAMLKRTSRLLEVEKEKTDNLLYQMLPVKVANMLRDGKTVDAEKYNKCTILFSDIVTFTNISAAVQPIQIVQMLNDLYSRFDALTNSNGVYKVETIGDAYMVVGGVPEVSDKHAQNVANQGLGMVVKAAEVKSPATGLPLQIRVGIHSGPIVAGVVGNKMPRYCLFGDTVNTASRMESHGVPGRVHVSSSTYEELLNDPDYKFQPRGETMIKGKGMMNTYFLQSNGDITIEKAEAATGDPAINQTRNETHTSNNTTNKGENNDSDNKAMDEKHESYDGKGDSPFNTSRTCSII